MIVAEAEKESEKKIPENEHFKHMTLASNFNKQMRCLLGKAEKKVLKNIF